MAGMLAVGLDLYAVQAVNAAFGAAFGITAPVSAHAIR